MHRTPICPLLTTCYWPPERQSRGCRKHAGGCIAPLLPWPCVCSLSSGPVLNLHDDLSRIVTYYLLPSTYFLLLLLLLLLLFLLLFLLCTVFLYFYIFSIFGTIYYYCRYPPKIVYPLWHIYLYQLYALLINNLLLLPPPLLLLLLLLLLLRQATSYKYLLHIHYYIYNNKLHPPTLLS